MSYDLPLYKALQNYAKENKISFHMPGHKHGKTIPNNLKKEDIFKIDLTELDDTDNLHAPKHSIMRAQEKAAQAFNSKETFFLVNGSTCGVQAMIASTCNPGDEIIVDRNCHSSLISSLILCGIIPRYVYPKYMNEYGFPGGINPQDIEKALNNCPKTKAVFITYPNYYGICSDIKNISDIVHRHGKILLVDEAHGAHLYFNNELPIGSLEAGADMCVQSAHKTMPALTQSSFLHVNSDEIDIDRLKSSLRMFQTSSPSFVLMAYLDVARGIMQKEGQHLLDELIKEVNYIREYINTSSYAICPTKELIGRFSIKDIDITRLTINFSQTGATGFEIAKLLNEEYDIQVEMADNTNIVCIISPGNTKEEISTLGEVVVKIAQTKIPNKSFQALYPSTYQSLTPREAFFSKSEFIEVEKTAGKVCAETIVSYPPGVPVLCPGEIITDEIIRHILSIKSSGGLIMGIKDKNLLRVLKDVSG